MPKPPAWLAKEIADFLIKQGEKLPKVRMHGKTVEDIGEELLAGFDNPRDMRKYLEAEGKVVRMEPPEFEGQPKGWQYQKYPWKVSGTRGKPKSIIYEPEELLDLYDNNLVRRGAHEYAERFGLKALRGFKHPEEAAQRLLGAVGAAGLGGALLASDEAEAFPAGKFTKATKKAVEGMLSSATKRLKGHTLDGRVIKEVRKGRGDWRAIIFDDGSMQTVQKQYVNDLCRAKGTKDYVNRFDVKDRVSKTEQALKSLSYHHSRSQLMVSRDTARKLHRDYLTRAREFGEDVPPDTQFVYYNGRYFQMPKVYTDLLDELGIVEIMKGRRDKAATKPYKRKK